MDVLEPVPDEPAAVATVVGDRALVIADYHAGVESALRYEQGVEVPNRAGERRGRLFDLLAETEPDRLIVLGDLMHSIGGPGGAERGELEVLFESLPGDLPVTLVKGNHDGDIESWLSGIEVIPGAGVRLGEVGFTHGHTWPDRTVLEGSVVCLGHEHPFVSIEDEVGGRRLEPVWLRGRADPEPFQDRSEYDGLSWLGGDDEAPEIVVFPPFNRLVGGTWVNVPEQSFLAPYLPAGAPDADAYLLDGTRLGRYRSV